MSLQSVREFLAKHAADIEILQKETSTATVSEAAQAFGVMPGQIAKTLSLWCNDQVILVILSGQAKVNNQKFKSQFKTKAKFLTAEEVVEWTSHPVGGVCPFGLPHPLQIYVDVSLKQFDMVLPAAGATNAALRLNPDRLAELTLATWVDVASN